MAIVQPWPAEAGRRHRRWGGLWGALDRLVWRVAADRRPLDPAAGGTGGSSGAATPPSAVPGDLPGFEAFFREHERAIFGYLFRMTGEEQAAYDLSQETFLRAWQRYDRLRGYERPASWLFRVATNLALNHLRRRGTPPGAALSLGEGVDPMASDPTWRFAERDAMRDAIREALLGMNPRQRAALVLREVYGLSGEEVAAALGITHAAAKMTLSRARAAFRAGYRRGEEASR